MIARVLLQLQIGLFQVLIELLKFIVEQIITGKPLGEQTPSAEDGREDTNAK